MKHCYRNLNIAEREALLQKLLGVENGFENNILEYYSITKRQVETHKIRIEYHIDTYNNFVSNVFVVVIKIL